MWKTHSELDFFCFGDEAVEAMKKYAANAASKEVVEALTVPNLIKVDPSIKDVGNAAPQEVATSNSQPPGP